MRKGQQQLILALLQTMKDANGEIKQFFQQGKLSTVMGLLSAQQDGVAQIIDFMDSIEKTDDEGARIIDLLVDYYKKVYVFSEQIKDTDDSFVAHLERALDEIEESVRNDVKLRLEVLFLSYKASMSDSLESIWRAAKNDPQCDAYFISIPYYDRSHGSVGDFHDESALHPDYIPLTDWRTYDIPKRRPDIIFFYNPYDENNRVTSVHPNFYSRKLKTCTDMLCYVPYFVTSDNVADHSVICAGPLYADKVFLESEMVRDKYVRVFQAFEKENNCVGHFGYAEDKFIASGHPKYDKVINAKREDYALSDSWRRLIERPDGTWKNIVLYNTNVAGLLTANEQLLAKLEHVFSVFKNRDDAVLWWRPHPLTEATFHSMRPHLADAYKVLVDQYKSDGIGIYDDTPDPHRAICLSSAYYGDDSSLLALYQCTGKPIMFHDASLSQVPPSAWYMYMTAFCNTGRYSWFMAVHCNGLFRLDRQNKQVKYMGGFPKERTGGWLSYAIPVQVDDALYFAPYHAEHVARYDMTTGTFQRIPIPSPTTVAHKRLYDMNVKFANIIAHGTALYFVPFSYPGILVYNLETGQMTVLDDWVSPLNELINDPVNPYMALYAFDEKRNRILLPCCCANVVLELDPDTHDIQLCTIGDAAAKYVGVHCSDGICWLLREDKPALVRWDPVTGDHKTFDVDPAVCEREDMPQFNYLVREGDRLFLTPVYAKKMLAFDLTTETMTVIDSFTPSSQENNDCVAMLTAIDGLLYFQAFPSRRLITYDLATGALREETIELSDPEDINTLREDHFFRPDSLLLQPNDGIIAEMSFATISDLLDIMAQPEKLSRMDMPAQVKALREATIVHADGKAGEDIYTFCKNLVLRR